MLLDMGTPGKGDRLTMALKDQPDRLPLVADLLMDAAYADDRLEGDEKAAVKRLLREILEAQTLPMDLDFRIDEFDPKQFNREQTLAHFLADPKDLKQRLLELVAAVHAADGEIDFVEDEQLRAVGAGLGLAPEDFQDSGGRGGRGDRPGRGPGSAALRRRRVSARRHPAHHLAFWAISSAFCGHQAPAAGPWLQRPSDSPGGLSQ